MDLEQTFGCKGLTSSPDSASSSSSRQEGGQKGSDANETASNDKDLYLLHELAGGFLGVNFDFEVFCQITELLRNGVSPEAVFEFLHKVTEHKKSKIQKRTAARKKKAVKVEKVDP